MKRIEKKTPKIEFTNPHWAQKGHKHWQFYCPFCGVSRRLKMRPKPESRHFFQVGLTAAFLTALGWPWFGIKGLVVFLPIWIVFEVLYRLRVRAELSCQNCGFDPILYLADLPMARREMQAFWSKKKPASTPEAPPPAAVSSTPS
jgi:predicted RNA-binding Zn-ribbon protein involved in translation (DUF1610 family)